MTEMEKKENKKKWKKIKKKERVKEKKTLMQIAEKYRGNDIH